MDDPEREVSEKRGKNGEEKVEYSDSRMLGLSCLQIICFMMWVSLHVSVTSILPNSRKAGGKRSGRTEIGSVIHATLLFSLQAR